MTPALRDEIREALVACAPEKGLSEELAPDERLPFFLPTSAFRNALSPDIYLILGDRGAGKTMLFRVLSDEGPQVLEGALQASTSVGFGRRRGDYSLPSPMDVASMLAGADDRTLRLFWMTLLARRLADELNGLSEPVRAALTSTGAIEEWFPVLAAASGELLGALDRLDQGLAEREEWRFVLYDDLDILVPNWEGLFPPLRGLFAFWLERCRQWLRLRPKIFLRVDLFRSDSLAFPDGAKFFAAHKVDLTWSASQLYMLLLKRMMNQQRSIEYVAWLVAVLHNRLDARELPNLGWTPMRGHNFSAPLMASLVGPYMGANPRKGRSHEWVPNHLADANGQLSPRSWLRMFRLAAEISRGIGDSDRPLTPACFFGAESEVSRLRILELADEDPWITRLIDVLRGELVPMDNDVLAERLARVEWRVIERGPPVEGVPAIIDYLTSRGLLERRVDGRLNVPEIYRHGLGLRRRGGVKRNPEAEGV